MLAHYFARRRSPPFVARINEFDRLNRPVEISHADELISLTRILLLTVLPYPLRAEFDPYAQVATMRSRYNGVAGS